RFLTAQSRALAKFYEPTCRAPISLVRLSSTCIATGSPNALSRSSDKAAGVECAPADAADALALTSPAHVLTMSAKMKIPARIGPTPVSTPQRTKGTMIQEAAPAPVR